MRDVLCLLGIIALMVASLSMCIHPLYADAPNTDEVQHKLTEMKSDDPMVRSAAAEYFVTHRGIAEAYVPLLDGLNDSDGFVRYYCAVSLAGYKKIESIPALKKYLDYTSREGIDIEVFAALQSISTIDEVYGRGLVDECLKSTNMKLKNNAIMVIGLVFKEINRITPYLDDKDSSTRIKVINTLGMIDTPEVAVVLRKALTSKRDVGEIVEIMKKLGSNSDGLATATLIDLLKDNNPVIRVAAVEIVGGRRGDNIVEALVDLIAKDKDAGVRKAIIRAIAFNDDNRITPAFVILLKDNDTGVRAEVALALGKRISFATEMKWASIDKERESVKALMFVIDDEAGVVSANVALSLGAYKDKAAMEPLTRALRNDYYRTRSNAALSLFAIGGDESLDIIGKAMGRELDHIVLKTMINVIKQMKDKQAAAKYIDTAIKNAHKDEASLESAGIAAYRALTNGGTLEMK